MPALLAHRSLPRSRYRDDAPATASEKELFRHHRSVGVSRESSESPVLWASAAETVTKLQIGEIDGARVVADRDRDNSARGTVAAPARAVRPGPGASAQDSAHGGPADRDRRLPDLAIIVVALTLLAALAAYAWLWLPPLIRAVLVGDVTSVPWWIWGGAIGACLLGHLAGSAAL